MASIKKKTLDKILLELNLTSEQIVEEGFIDSFKNKFSRKKSPAPAWNKPAPTASNAAYAADSAYDSLLRPKYKYKPTKMNPDPAAAQAPGTAPASVTPPGDLKATTVKTIEQLKGLANSLEQQAAAMPTINTQQASRLYQQLTSFLVDGIKKAQSAMVPGTAGLGPRAEDLPQAPAGITQPDGTQLPSSIAPQTNPPAAQAPTVPNTGYQLPAGLAAQTPPIPNLMSHIKRYTDGLKKTPDQFTDEEWAGFAQELQTTPENLKAQYTQQAERNKTGVIVPGVVDKATALKMGRTIQATIAQSKKVTTNAASQRAIDAAKKNLPKLKKEYLALPDNLKEQYVLDLLGIKAKKPVATAGTTAAGTTAAGTTAPPGPTQAQKVAEAERLAAMHSSRNYGPVSFLEFDN